MKRIEVIGSDWLKLYCFLSTANRNTSFRSYLSLDKNNNSLDLDSLHALFITTIHPSSNHTQQYYSHPNPQQNFFRKILTNSIMSKTSTPDTLQHTAGANVEPMSFVTIGRTMYNAVISRDTIAKTLSGKLNSELLSLPDPTLQQLLDTFALLSTTITQSVVESKRHLKSLKDARSTRNLENANALFLAHETIALLQDQVINISSIVHDLTAIQMQTHIATLPSANVTNVTASSSETKSTPVNKQVYLDAKQLATDLAAGIRTTNHGKYNKTTAASNYLLFKQLCDITHNPLDENKKDMSSKYKVKALAPLTTVLTAAIKNAYGGCTIDPNIIQALLSNNENHSVTLIFSVKSSKKKNGSLSGSQRNKQMKSLTDTTDLHVRTELWDQLTKSQIENQDNVTYHGSEFHNAIQFYTIYWYFLNFDVWFSLSMLLTRIDVLTRTTFGFPLAFATPRRHLNFLNALYILLDTLVAYAKLFATDAFDPMNLNPLKDVSSLQLNSESNLTPEIKTATSALLQVMRESRTQYHSSSKPAGTTIQDTDGNTSIVNDDGVLLVHKGKNVSFCKDFTNGGNCKCSTYTIDNVSYNGHLKNGRLVLH